MLRGKKEVVELKKLSKVQGSESMADAGSEEDLVVVISVAVQHNHCDPAEDTQERENSQRCSPHLPTSTEPVLREGLRSAQEHDQT